MEGIESYKGPEKRRSVRWYERLPVKYILVNDTDKPEFSPHYEGIMRNISAVGMCVETTLLSDDWKERLLYGTIKVAVTLNLPNSTTDICALSKIAWLSRLPEKNAHLLGLEFMDITTTASDTIKDYIISFYLKRT